MTVKYLFFYAAPADIAFALLHLEANAPLKFVQTDILPSPNREIYLKSSELPHPGLIEQPYDGFRTYMVSHRDTKNALYSLVANDGRRLWELRNGDNEETVLLTLGGVTGSGAVLEGQMSTLHSTRISQQLMRWFLSALKRQNFTRINGCWVGPDALEMLKAGKRLTQAEQAPLDADLKWPGAVGSLTEVDLLLPRPSG